MRKLLLILLAVIMVLPLSVLPAGAKTASDAAAFDKIAVETDLAGTTIGGIKFNPARYGYDEKGTLQILTMLEYGYPDDPALYLYLYNPQDLALNTRDRRYAVTLALGGEAENYTKYPLKVLSMSGTGEHSRLWIKCRIDVGADRLTTAFKDKQERTYRLGEIELVIGDKIQAFPIGGEWTYSGTTAGGDLTSEAKLISVIELELHPLVYRGDGAIDPYKYDQINSVYFSIPQNFEEKNGKIKCILCTWKEYDSGWVLACKTDRVYQKLFDIAGKPVGAENKAYPRIISYIEPANVPLFSWNVNTYIPDGLQLFNPDVLQWVVKYDGSKAEYGAMLDTGLQEQIAAAWNAYNNGEENYFSSGGETKIVDILKDQNFTVKVNDPSASWWQRIFSKDCGTMETNNQAFQRVTTAALKDPEATLFVDQSYKDELALALSTATVREEDLMVLHFASSDFYSIPVYGKGWASNKDTWVDDGKEDMYACKEQLYMDFDIIQFTCEKDGENVVVPVAASPINVIGDLQFFNKMKDIPKWVIILIAIILIAVVLFLCPPLLPILVKVVVLPFKLLWWILRAIGKGFAALFHKRE